MLMMLIYIILGIWFFKMIFIRPFKRFSVARNKKKYLLVLSIILIINLLSSIYMAYHGGIGHYLIEISIWMFLSNLLLAINS